MTGFTATLDGQVIVAADDNDTITFTFTANTSTVTPFSIPNAYGFTNSVGTGTFSIHSPTSAFALTSAFIMFDMICRLQEIQMI